MKKDFKENELIIYQNGDRFEIGRIKRLTEDGAFVYYHSGDTASKTPFDCMHKLNNNYCVIETNLGGMNNTNERIKKALDLAWKYGQIDGNHHKMWVIDQMVKVLCGNEEEYTNWVKKYTEPLEDGDYYSWDCGIAP